MSYDAKSEWNKAISENEMAYPAEYVIRIFKGKYPMLDLKKNGSYIGKKICDVGCGDGRNLVLLKQCGFEIYGIEITHDIVDRVKFNLRLFGIDDADIRVGSNDRIFFENSFFDYLLSWNSCYYVGNIREFNLHVREYARVLKKGGYLVMSIPKKTCFIYEGAERLNDSFYIIKNDPFNIRNGEVFRMFKDADDIKNTFSGYFNNFIFANIHDDCFGYNYHWHLVVCNKK